jgi:hypothetical protein
MPGTWLSRVKDYGFYVYIFICKCVLASLIIIIFLVLDNFLAMFRLHRESNLLACVTDDFSISIVDIDNR